MALNLTRLPATSLWAEREKRGQISFAYRQSMQMIGKRLARSPPLAATGAKTPNRKFECNSNADRIRLLIPGTARVASDVTFNSIKYNVAGGRSQGLAGGAGGAGEAGGAGGERGC